MEGTSDTHVSCMCFAPWPLRKKSHAKSQPSAPAAPATPALLDNPAAEALPTAPAKVDLPAGEGAALPETTPKDLDALESSSPQSDSIPAATSSASPASSPPAPQRPRSRQATDEPAAACAPDVSQDHSGTDVQVPARTCKLSQSDMITISTTRIPTKSISTEETVTLVADSSAEATADIMIDITNSLHPSTPAALPPSKIPTPPCSRTTSQDVAVLAPHPQQTTTPNGPPLNLQRIMQDLPFSISPPSSPTAAAATTAACPGSPVTIVNISVNHYNYQLHPDGTWAPQGCQRSASAPHPAARGGPIIVEMPSSQQLSRIPSRPVTPPNVPPTRIPSCPAPSRTSSLGGTRIPVASAPAPPPPKRLTSAPTKLAITNASS